MRRDGRLDLRSPADEGNLAGSSSLGGVVSSEQDVVSSELVGIGKTVMLEIAGGIVGLWKSSSN